MDPNATWDALKEALAEKDFARIERATDELIMWLQKGGSLPQAVQSMLDRSAFHALLQLLWTAAREYQTQGC